MTSRPSLKHRLKRPPDIFVDKEIITLLDKAERFEGACMDIGAEKTVVGKRQAEAYLASHNPGVTLGNKSGMVYRFGGGRHPCVGTVAVRIPITDSFMILIEIDVVAINVPLLLGLDFLDRHNMYVNNTTNRLVCVNEGIQVPLVRKMGHIFFEWEAEILYTFPELQRIHKHFFHANSERLYALMRRAKIDDAVPLTLKQLQDVADACDVCQRLGKEPNRFRVALPHEDVCFNRLVLLDLMFLEGEAVLHVVDADTLWSAAGFMGDGQTADATWDLFVKIWVAAYVGYPQELHVDQGPQLQAPQWRARVEAAGIKQRDSGVESHNSLGAGERYHAFLRQIFRRVRAAHPTIDKGQALSLSVWAMNQTAGPMGISPVLLVFGINPRMPVNPVDLPMQRERNKALVEARADMVKHVARARLSTVVRRNVPKASNTEISPGMRVLVYREKPVDEWQGPYTVQGHDGKQVWLDINDRLNLFSIDKVKLYLPPLETTEETPADVATDTVGNEDMGNVVDAIIAGDTLVCSLGQRLGYIQERAYRDTQAEAETPSRIFKTEVLKPEDPRVSTAEAKAARLEEASGLVKRGAFKKVRRDSLPADASILKGRFVDAIKHVGTNNAKFKSRYVLQGHNDKEKPFIVHNISTLRQSSTKIILSTSAVLNFRIFSHDVNQAYLQSKERLTRTIYLQPRPADAELFGVGDGEVLLLLLPLYGMCDAGDYWAVTLTGHVKDDLGMVPLTGDPSLFIKEENGRTVGLLGGYVDDLLNGGDESFQTLTQQTLETFESKPRVWDNLEFVGAFLKTLDGSPRCFVLSQESYVAAASKLPTDISFDAFVSARAGFGWLAHSRPDLCCAINRAAQVTAETFCERHVRELNKAIKYAHSTKDLGLTYGPLSRETLHLRAYSDASFANNDDLSSQLGYIVMLCDGDNNCHVLSYSSKKARRVVRSIMAGEVYAFADAFDTAFILKHDLERIYHQHLPLVMLTDSKQMFDVITRASHTTEKRLMIDVAAAREAYNRHEISNVGLVQSEHNIADGLTKPGQCAALSAMMKTAKDVNPVQQWVTRTDASPRHSGVENPGV